MATMNAVNTTLAGQTGTGNFVGATSPTFVTSATIPLLKLTGGDITDINDDIVLQLGAAGSAVNFINIDNSNTGDPLQIEAVGLDASVSINYKTVGTGTHNLYTTGNTGIVFQSGTAHQHVTNFAFANTAATRTVTFPDADGTVAYVSNVLTWNSVAGSFEFAVVNNGYVTTSGSLTTIALPATAAVGSVIAIGGQGSGGWTMTANTGQTIKMTSSTTTTAGSLSSTNQYDCIEVVCVVANTTWVVRSAVTAGFTIA